MLAMPIIICALGLFLMIRIKPFFLTHPLKVIRAVAPSLKNRESRESFFLALAGTLGVGNIFGVAFGIIVGGAGSIFWLVLSSFFSMIIKYSEVVLGFSSRNIRYGMPSVIRDSLPYVGKGLSYIYAVLGILLSLFMGALMQSRSILDIAREGGLSLSPIQAVIVVFTLYFVIFGSEKIKKATYYIIPLTTIIYIFLAVFVVFSNFSRIFDSIIYVLKSAFNFRSAAGGAVGAILKCGFGEGFLRGVMSNEAGAGTSLVGHSAEPGRTAGVAGVFGIFEVVFDTLILCPLTGLVIITSGVPITDSPMGLVNSAFANSFGEGISPLLLLIVFFFAYSTLMSLYYYGAVYSEYLAFPKWIFSVLFVFFIAVSAVFSNAFVTAIDVLLLLMTIPTALCIIKSVGMIKHHTDELLK